MPEAIIYPLENYTFGTKEAQPEEDPSVSARMKRLETDFKEQGMRRSVEAVLVVHHHNHPHVLMLQIANSFFKLPGHYLKPNVSEKEGLQEILNLRLGPEDPKEWNNKEDWKIGEKLSTWWRPNFETYMYPYIPAHVTEPKEKKSLYIVHLPPKKVLSVPKNMKLLAIPLFELYDNSARYGAQLSTIAHLLSRYDFIFEQQQQQ
ncbi:Cleavage/polyadenylation specificity factor subunit 5 [Cokeromyces recurvatus]|uniref:Cleavage/polyadenylation specificity factor subunit 5 n=1 Tax=Cokeromyces recurvatus TaxID=90255 RepID=UPI002220ACB2|nr:Cleavage/polyadenylation specificity factor subunit 5 [Cokeromyces recurvatus]KAI7898633.1 Cleavage/polyadenylation specificity factor subunit 5 [Cokeromyces recurvatus]